MAVQRQQHAFHELGANGGQREEQAGTGALPFETEEKPHQSRGRGRAGSEYVLKLPGTTVTAPAIPFYRGSLPC